MEENVIMYPVTTEKAVWMIETQNSIQLIVRKDATKAQIKKSVEDEFQVKVDKVNVLITPRGMKKAIIKLKPEFKADDIAAKLKIA